MMLSFETFAKKGAIACFMYDNCENISELTMEQAIEILKNLPKQKIKINNTVYEGYILNLPVMRPGQRYTELSKPSNRISRDIVTKAILNQHFRVPEYLEEEYKRLKEFRSALEIELEATY